MRHGALRKERFAPRRLSAVSNLLHAPPSRRLLHRFDVIR
jgi:hypothetical protein